MYELGVFEIIFRTCYYGIAVEKYVCEKQSNPKRALPLVVDFSHDVLPKVKASHYFIYLEIIIGFFL